MIIPPPHVIANDKSPSGWQKWIPQQRKSQEAKLRDPLINYFLCSFFRFSYLEAMLKERKRKEKMDREAELGRGLEEGEETFKNESVSGTKVTLWVSQMWFRQPPHKNWSMPAVQTHPHSLQQQSVLRHLISIIHLPKSWNLLLAVFVQNQPSMQLLTFTLTQAQVREFKACQMWEAHLHSMENYSD